MAEDTKTTEEATVVNTVPAVDTNAGAANVVAKSVYGEKRRNNARRPMGRKGESEKRDEFDQRILDLARVTRVMAGGKRMRFRACVVVGDRKGKVGIGMGKGADVTLAMNKAVNDAKKALIDVPMINETIPHEVYEKFGAAKILFKPAKKGRGVIAGGCVRIILEMAGVKNIVSKILGTNNKVSNAKCTINALKRLRKVGQEGQNSPKEKTEEKKAEKVKAEK